MPVTTTILQDGPNNTRIRVDGIALTAAVPYTVIANPATLSFMDQTFGLHATALRIDKIDYDIEDLVEIDVLWGNTTPANADPVWTLTGRGCVDNVKYKDLNNTKAAGWDGTIAIQSGLPVPSASGGDSFTFILSLVKQRIPNTN